MSEWKKYKLGDLGIIVTGKTPSKNNPEDWGNEMPFITPTDYKNYRKKAYSSERKLSKEGIERLNNKILPPKSILVTCIGSDMGKVVINAISAITNQQINAIIPDNSKIDNDFLYYQLISLYEILRIYGGDGTAVPIVNKGDFETIIAEIPSLLEQKTIAFVLSNLDDKIDLLHRQNKTLEAMAETLFRQWFIEEAKEDWEEKILFDISEHKKVNIRPDKNLTIEYNHYSIPAFDKGENPVKELGIEIKSNKYKIFENSILISKLNPRFPRVWSIWKEFENKENPICSTEFQIVYPNKKEYFSFIYYLLKSSPVTNELIGAASGTSGSHQRVKPQDIFNISFLFNENKAIEFHNLVKNNLDKIKDNKTQIITLEKLRDTLLPKLMSGEVRVEI